MLKDFINNYILLPIVFIIVWGGMIVAGIIDQMKKEDRVRKFGF